MNKIKRWVPFRVWPMSWGLSGESFERAWIDYYYTGVDNRRLKAKIGVTDKYKLAEIDLEIDADIGLIDDYEFRIKQSKLQLDKDLETNDDLYSESEEESAKKMGRDKIKEEFKARKLLIDFEHDKISEAKYKKEKATLLNEPHVEIIDVDFNKDRPEIGAFELDWNDAFIAFLSSHGYTGTSDEDIVNQWINGVFRSVIAQDIADQDFGLVPHGERDDVEFVRDAVPFIGEGEGDSGTANIVNDYTPSATKSTLGDDIAKYYATPTKEKGGANKTS